MDFEITDLLQLVRGGVKQVAMGDTTGGVRIYGSNGTFVKYVHASDDEGSRIRPRND